MNLKEFLKENKGSIIFVIFITIFYLIFFLPENEKRNKSLITNPDINKEMIERESVLSSIEAKSYYVYDILENKPIFSKDEHVKLPLASITKLMSGFVAMSKMPATTIITINEDDIALDADNGLSDGFLKGEKWKLKDLLDLSLIISSNGGIHAIASAFNSYEAVNNENIVGAMNKEADSMSLKDTIFINETGLDIDGNMSGAYSSAYDVSMVLGNIIKNNPELISATNEKREDFVSLSNIKHTALNTNTSINEISGLMASKTGFTDLAGGNLAVVFDAGIMHPVAIVVLGSSSSGRFSDVVKLAKITLEKLSD